MSLRFDISSKTTTTDPACRRSRAQPARPGRRCSARRVRASAALASRSLIGLTREATRPAGPPSGRSRPASKMRAWKRRSDNVWSSG